MSLCKSFKDRSCTPSPSSERLPVPWRKRVQKYCLHTKPPRNPPKKIELFFIHPLFENKTWQKTAQNAPAKQKSRHFPRSTPLPQKPAHSSKNHLTPTPYSSRKHLSSSKKHFSSSESHRTFQFPRKRGVPAENGLYPIYIHCCPLKPSNIRTAEPPAPKSPFREISRSSCMPHFQRITFRAHLRIFKKHLSD